ncbi:MAG: RNA polymerase sigma-70 factor [Draconibacterium sp.]
MKESEANIIRKLKEGDEYTYVYLFREYYVSLCMYAKKYLGSKELAEDIVSETYFNIWRNRANLEISVSLKSYLFQATCNNSLNYLRKMRREESLEDYLGSQGNGIITRSESNDQLPVDYLINKDLKAEIQRAMEKLPQQQKTVFTLKWSEGKKNREIADILGLSEKTVEMHIHNANLKMKKYLKHHFDDLKIILLIALLAI